MGCSQDWHGKLRKHRGFMNCTFKPAHRYSSDPLGVENRRHSCPRCGSAHLRFESEIPLMAPEKRAGIIKGSLLARSRPMVKAVSVTRETDVLSMQGLWLPLLLSTLLLLLLLSGAIR